jgi:hypothetical protein
MAEYDRSATGPLPVDAGPRRAESIFDLSPEDFRASLGEMQALGHDTDALMRQYRARNSPFAPINNAAEAQAQDLADSGRRPVLGGLLSKPEGATGMDAIMGLEREGWRGLLGAGQQVGQAFDAPAAAYQGLIPDQDVNMEALNTAGMAMGAGGAATAPSGSLRMGAALNDRDMFHGTPDVRDLRTAGAFEQMTQGATRISDLDAWQRLGQQIEDVGPTTPQGIDLAITRSNLLEQQRVNKPVFATPDRRTAATYADDTRAFDYQRAEPAIVSMQSSPQRILDVNAGGSDFRGISLERVKNGFRDAGISDAEIDDAISRYIVAPRSDGKVSTNDLSAVSQSLGFDAVDVANVRDAYNNNNRASPATVRMLFNSDQINIGGMDLMANASQSGGLLGAGLSEAQRQARDILDMRAAGRARSVTDDMMARADDQYMFDNTPLPMDEASRLARADVGGFGGDLYHGTNKDFDAFNSMPWGGETPNIANEYAASTAWNGGTGQQVLPVRMAVNSPLDADRMPRTVTIGDFVTEALDQSPAIGRGDFNNEMAAARVNNINRGARQEESGPNYNRQDFWNNDQSMFGTHGTLAKDSLMDQLGFDGVNMIEMGEPTTGAFNTANIRSRFARFDPEFSHLSNLSAANASPAAGLLASGAQEQDKPLPFMEMLRGLLR